MKPAFEDTNLQIPAATAEPQDYTGEDGLLYCSKCYKAKEAYFSGGMKLFGRDRHPAECDCQRAARKEREAAEKLRLAALGQGRHREKLSCGLYRQCPYGAGGFRLHDELCPYPE